MVPTAIEIFAGCGGLSTGLLDAGIDLRLGTDYYPAAMRTFEYNHTYRKAKALTANVYDLTGEKLLGAAGVSKNKLQLLVGGPPCQPFSIIGKRQALQDPRGDLVFQFVRLLQELNPEAFIFENVANLSSISNGEVFTDLLSKMQNVGYSTSFAVLHAADYGIAQMRKRLFIIGVRDGKALSFPPPTTHGTRILLGEQPIRTCRDILDDLPDVSEDTASLIPNHEPTDHSPAMIAAFEKLAPGSRDPKSHHDRLHPDKPSYTLRAGSGNFSPLRPVHYKYHRVITVRESARIQGFCDDFIWPTDIPRLQQYRQVGNAVPPPLARVVAQHLASELGWDIDPARFQGDITQREAIKPSSAIERAQQRKKLIRGASLGHRL